MLEAWMRSYEPELLFDERGALVADGAPGRFLLRGRVSDQHGVVEGERRDPGERVPCCLGGIVATCHESGFAGLKAHGEQDADGPAPGVASRVAVGADLPHAGRRGETRLLRKLPQRRMFQHLVLVDEAAGQRPVALEGRRSAPDQQDIAGVGHAAEDGDVDGERGARVLVGRHAHSIAEPGRRARPSAWPATGRSGPGTG